MGKTKTDRTPVRVENLGFVIDGNEILRDINLQVCKNEIVGLIGPNGCGKSTLLKNIYRHYQPTTGAVYLSGDDIRGLRSKEAARRMAVVAQENQVAFDFSVKEIVEMGRYAHQSMFQSSEGNEAVCKRALELVGMQQFEKRSFLSLSGGEKQRVYMAAAFAQQSPVLILDEPTNHLDIGYQLLLMEMMQRQRNETDLTIFTSVHDMNLAAWYCDRLIVMKSGRLLAQGRPEDVLTEEMLASVFHVRASITKRAEDGKLQIQYLGYL